MRSSRPPARGHPSFVRGRRRKGGAGHTVGSSSSEPGANPEHGAHNGPESIWVEDGPGAQRWSVLCGVAGLAQLLPTVGQQLLDPPRWMGADSIQHVAEVNLRVDSQLFARRA
jgi:hypothetical protein